MQKFKIFKSKDFPTKNKFIAACEAFKYYYKERQKAVKPQKPRNFHPLVREYVSQELAAKAKGEEPPTLEFVNLTEKEWQATQDQKENQKKNEERRQAEEDTTKVEEDAAEAREGDLKKAASDPEFKKEFIRSEMDKAGFTAEAITFVIADQLWDGKRSQEFQLNRRKTRQDIEDEIKQHA